MMRSLLSLFFIGSFFTAVQTAQASQNLCSQIGELKHCHSGEWKLAQDALDNGRTILRFRINQGSELNLFITEQPVILNSMLTEDMKIQIETCESYGSLTWFTTKAVREGKSGKVYATLFSTTYEGKQYYGYASGESEAVVSQTVSNFLKSLNTDVSRSLTGPDFKGKKYYFGWGAAGVLDPSLMQNEVKYDVLHTHDIFTKEVGGSYLGTKYTDYKTATATNIKKTWSDIQTAIKADDMYVQYSSGHGSSTGLGVGVTYDQIRDQVLKFGAKEAIVFIMACQSGGLVDSFNKKKAEWLNFQSQGKTLFVMASSKTFENSSTGPGTDPEQPNSPNGSAGSAFGHALWKALIGHSDGETSGVKDGYLSIEEIRNYSIKKTQDVGGHTPVSTGSYDAKLIMNRVPSKAFIDSLGITSEGLSDEAVMERIRELDQALRI